MTARRFILALLLLISPGLVGCQSLDQWISENATIPDTGIPRDEDEFPMVNSYVNPYIKDCCKCCGKDHH